jgi:hypothetical protein
MHYGWSKEFLETSKRRLAGNTAQPPADVYFGRAETILAERHQACNHRKPPLAASTAVCLNLTK